VVNALLDTGELIRINSEVLFRPSAIAIMVDYILQRGSDEAPFTVAEFRDHFRPAASIHLHFWNTWMNLVQRGGRGRAE